MGRDDEDRCYGTYWDYGQVESIESDKLNESNPSEGTRRFSTTNGKATLK